MQQVVAAIPDELKAEQAEIVVKVWGDILKIVNQILDVHKRFGFTKFEAMINPSITEILNGLGIVGFTLTSFVKSGLLDHDEARQALNAKQCVLHIERLAVALQDRDKEEYEKVMGLLSAQAPF